MARRSVAGDQRRRDTGADPDDAEEDRRRGQRQAAAPEGPGAVCDTRHRENGHPQRHARAGHRHAGFTVDQALQVRGEIGLEHAQLAGVQHALAGDLTEQLVAQRQVGGGQHDERHVRPQPGPRDADRRPPHHEIERHQHRRQHHRVLLRQQGHRAPGDRPGVVAAPLLAAPADVEQERGEEEARRHRVDAPGDPGHRLGLHRQQREDQGGHRRRDQAETRRPLRHGEHQHRVDGVERDVDDVVGDRRGGAEAARRSGS